MSDIFISYARKDRARAKVLAGALERQGWSVWWDPKILPGERFAKIIKKELDKAKCVIVLWSKWSIESDWVQDEASEGNRRKILVPAKIDDVDIPLGFKSIQTARLVDWKGRSPHPEFDTLLKAISAILGQPLLPEASEPTPDEQQSENEIHTLLKDKPKDYKQKDKPLSKEPQKRQPEAGDIITNSIGMKLVYIPTGSFMMGSPSNEKERRSDETPQHQVRISEGFWMGQTQVTQGQYKSMMNAQPWSGKQYVQEDPNNPAVYVSWEDAVEFCEKLSVREGKTYRLPAEAEWEYACRAGTTTRFSFGDSDSSLGNYAWYQSNSTEVGQKYAHPVGQKKHNPWSLYDMHGNVWEWCSDWYYGAYYYIKSSVTPKGASSGTHRSMRGGSWGGDESSLRCSYRAQADPGRRYGDVGFRVVRSQ